MCASCGLVAQCSFNFVVVFDTLYRLCRRPRGQLQRALWQRYRYRYVSATAGTVHKRHDAPIWGAPGVHAAWGLVYQKQQKGLY